MLLYEYKSQSRLGVRASSEFFGVDSFKTEERSKCKVSIKAKLSFCHPFLEMS